MADNRPKSDIDWVCGQPGCVSTNIVVLVVPLGVLLVIWELTFHPMIHGSPLGIVREYIERPEFYALAALNTGLHVGVGLLAGALIGYPLGAFLVLFREYWIVSSVLHAFAYTFPRVFWGFVFMYSFGLGEHAVYAMAVLVAVILLMCLGFQSGMSIIESVKKEPRAFTTPVMLLESRRALFRYYYFPQLLPDYFHRLRFASAGLWPFMLFGEFFAGAKETSLALHAFTNLNAFSMTAAWAGALLLAACALITWWLIKVIEWLLIE